MLGGEAIEVTTFRGEGAYLDGRRPESVTFHTDLEADLARRDFTINALAWDPLAPEFRDPFGGRADMARKLVRAVGDPAARFGEDGLRAMRAVRFAAQLGYGLHPRTRAAIPGALDVVARSPPSASPDELARLVVAPHAHRALGLMRKTGLLGVVLPALAAVEPGPRSTTPSPCSAASPRSQRVRFAALLHGLGAHEAGRILVALRQPRRVADDAAALVRSHACRTGAREPLPATPGEVRRWLSRVGLARVASQLALAEAEAAAVGDRAARAEVKKFAQAVARAQAESPPLSARDFALDGRALMAILGAGPGPHVGEALRHLLDRVLEDPSLNAPAALEREVRAWWLARKRPL